MLLKKGGVAVLVLGLLLSAGCSALRCQFLNRPPTCDFTFFPQSPLVGEKVTFTSLASDPDNNITSYMWDYGDGYVDSGIQVFKIYNTPGTYRVTHRIIDECGASDEKSIFLEVRPAELEIQIEGRPVIGEKIKFSVTFPGISFEWDFGDGTKGYGNPVYHTYRCWGLYEVKVTATTAAGTVFSASRTLDIAGIDGLPIACFDWGIDEYHFLWADGSCSRDDDMVCLDGPPWKCCISAWQWNLYWYDELLITTFGRTFEYLLVFEGIYTLILTVWDDEGSEGYGWIQFEWPGSP